MAAETRDKSKIKQPQTSRMLRLANVL